MRIDFAAFLALFIAIGSMNGASAETADIHEGINHIRLRECPRETAVKPLAASPALKRAAQRRANGEPLGEALSDAPGEFSTASILVVGGDIKTALTRLASRHCDKLADPGFTHIGAVFAKNRWWIALGNKDAEATETTEPTSPPVVASNEYAGIMLARINAARGQARHCGKERFQAAAPVGWNRQLMEAAMAHAADMVRRRYFAHASPEGQSVAERVRGAGYAFLAVGENIAAVPESDPALVVDGWLNSPGHCANIMSEDFNEIGAAFAHLPGTRQGKWVLVFGSRQ